jgi:ABC-type sugar transport system permease subunit
VYYALGTVPAEIILGLVLAYILYQDIVGKEAFRMIYFLPYITPSISTAVVFQIIFSSRETSLANRLIGFFGVDPLINGDLNPSLCLNCWGSMSPV